ncbi:6-phosphogluconolactonase [Alkaliphilus metalliredigens QYMF]|uniref:6-phosphogluconolactonase n=1 Tax=Alkaliphilus metalliredigens (strain QYMF) TaxID=293826 RepID=A6TTT0_ALKMQ|nr:6-phosphogluconolactonase [Alkaliphilus metalliredigens]ABR49598.1 6-phosphogluconolactonase [Alkaliphilus metalliredigens QYMF]
MHKGNIVLGTPQEVAKKLGVYVTALAMDSIRKHGGFTIGLSGGSSMDVFAKGILNKEIKASIDWSKWQVFWVDERWVPLTSTDSNYCKSKELFLDHVDIPKNQIHPYDTGLKPDEAARAYENMLSRVFTTGSEEIPQFDLILLGLGEDGHTASLFPQHPLLKEEKHWVSSLMDAPKAPPERMTFTLPLLNRTRHVAYIALGAGKSSILERVFLSNPSQMIPAQLVSPIEGKTQWFVDHDAYKDLGLLKNQNHHPE